MTEREEGSKQPVKVVDRRSFTPDGRRRSAESGETEERPEPEAPPTGPVAGEGFTMESPAGEGGPGSTPGEDPAFLNLVISLYNSGCLLLGLGGEERGEAPAREPDLEAARGTIDLLAALKRKTEGNLSTDESRIIESLLADLQMAYVMKAPRS